MTRRRRAALAIGVTAVTVLVPSFAVAHIERASYWPDPAPDTSVNPPAGGAIPTIDPLETALDESQPGDTRVVCQTGQAIEPPAPPTRRPDQQVNAPDITVQRPRSDQGVSRSEVDRLTAKIKQLRHSHRRKKARRLRPRLNAARQAYQNALTTELAAREAALQRYQRDLTALQAAQQRYQQDLAAEQAARQQADQDYQAALVAYAQAVQDYLDLVDNDPSMQELADDLDDEVANGYRVRPTAQRITVTEDEADDRYDLNAQLLAQCDYDSIQAAVTDSSNNDRVVVMPGTYTEPDSRAFPTHNPACDQYEETNDNSTSGAVGYRYQFHCPNDQNLIAVMGREPAEDGNGNEIPAGQPGGPPQPPLDDRHGIPDLGPCIRCNLHIEGSGMSPDDVIVDGGDPSLGDHSPPGADQDNYAKDVGIRVDRADGFVLNNIKVRHVNEHDVYVIETDGFHLDRLKVPYAGEYGVLTFVGDHSLIENCDAWGNGDSGLYPGAAAELGVQGFPTDPSQRRYGNEIRNCDMHHNALGYSGTDGNAVWVHDNEFYDNTQGFSTDVFTAPGHPGFPQDSDLIENNNFHGNNFNTYLTGCGAGESPGPNGPNQNCTDVKSTVPVPVGVGLWIAGGNDNVINNNRFWDNWRRGTMVFAVPDQFVCNDPGIQLANCNPAAATSSTSYRNESKNNIMGVAPGGAQEPNGVDFWWDQYPDNTGNCWHENTGKNGDAASVTSTPPSPLLPAACDNTSIGTGGAFGQDPELLACFASIENGDTTPGQPNCSWFDTPPKP